MRKRFIYDIKLVVQIKITGELDFVTRSFEAEIEIGEHDFFVPFVVDSDNVKYDMKQTLEDYASSRNMSISDIDVISTEVYTNDDMVDVFFKENDSNNSYDRNPIITVEFEPENYKPLTPQYFKGQDKIDHILWTWENVNNCAFRIYDQNNNIIAELGVGVFSFVETPIKRGENYTRKIAAFSADGESDCSKYATVSLSKEEYNDALVAENRFGYIDVEPINPVDTRVEKLDAFKSGIGDNHDLYTQTDSHQIHEVFDFDIVIEGEVSEKQEHYTAIDTKYKIVAEGTKEDDGPVDSVVDVTIKPWPISSVSYEMESHIKEDCQLSYQLGIDVAYQKEKLTIGDSGGISVGTGGSGGSSSGTGSAGNGTPNNPSGMPSWPGGNWIGGIGTDENHNWGINIGGEIFNPGDIIWDIIQGPGAIIINPDGTITGDKPGMIVIEGTLPNGDKVIVEAEVLEPVVDMPAGDKPIIDENGNELPPIIPPIVGDSGDGGGIGGGIIPTPEQEVPSVTYPPDTPGLPPDYNEHRCPTIYLYETTTIPLRLTSGGRLMDHKFLELDQHKEPPVFDNRTMPPTYIEGCLCCLETDDLTSLEVIKNVTINETTNEEVVRYHLKGNHVGRSHFRATYKGKTFHFNVHVVKLYTWITPEQHVLRVGDEVQYRLYKGGYEGSFDTILVQNREIEWAVDTNAAIKQNGVLLAEREGSYSVTAIYRGISAIATGLIRPPDIRFDFSTSITPHPEEDTYVTRVGRRILVKVYINEILASNKDISFRMLDENIATIDYNGYITGESVGQTQLEASYKGYKVLANVHVYNRIIRVTPQNENPPYDCEVYTGFTREIKLFDEGARIHHSELLFSSVSPSVASVSADGVITGEKVGSTDIRVIYNDITYTVSVNVLQSTLDVHPLSQSTFTVATHSDFFVCSYVNGSHINHNSIDLTYTTDNASIATVSKRGLVTGISPGKTILTARYKDLVVSEEVTVVLDGDGSSRYRIVRTNPSNADLFKGEFATISLQRLNGSRWDVVESGDIEWSLVESNGKITTTDLAGRILWTNSFDDLINVTYDGSYKYGTIDVEHDTNISNPPIFKCVIRDDMYGTVTKIFEYEIRDIPFYAHAIGSYTESESIAYIKLDERADYSGYRYGQYEMYCCLGSRSTGCGLLGSYKINLEKAKIEIYDKRLIDIEVVDTYKLLIKGKVSGKTWIKITAARMTLVVFVYIKDYLEVVVDKKYIDIFETTTVRLFANGEEMTYDPEGLDVESGFQIGHRLTDEKSYIDINEDGTLTGQYTCPANNRLILKRNGQVAHGVIGVNEARIKIEFEEGVQLPNKDHLLEGGKRFHDAFKVPFDNIKFKVYVNDREDPLFRNYKHTFSNSTVRLYTLGTTCLELDKNSNTIVRNKQDEAIFGVRFTIRGNHYNFDIQCGDVYVSVPTELPLLSEGNVVLVNEAGLNLKTRYSAIEDRGNGDRRLHSSINWLAVSISSEDKLCDNAIRFSYSGDDALNGSVILGGKKNKVIAYYSELSMSYNYKVGERIPDPLFFLRQNLSVPYNYDLIYARGDIKEMGGKSFEQYPFVFESEEITTTLPSEMPKPSVIYCDRALSPGDTIHDFGGREVINTFDYSWRPKNTIKCDIGNQQELYYRIEPKVGALSEVETLSFRGYIGQHNVFANAEAIPAVYPCNLEVAGVAFGEVQFDTRDYIDLYLEDKYYTWSYLGNANHEYYHYDKFLKIDILRLPQLYTPANQTQQALTGLILQKTSMNEDVAEISSTGRISFSKPGRSEIVLKSGKEHMPDRKTPLYVYCMEPGVDYLKIENNQRFVLKNSVFQPILNYHFEPTVDTSLISYPGISRSNVYSLTDDNKLIVNAAGGMRSVDIEYMGIVRKLELYVLESLTPNIDATIIGYNNYKTNILHKDQLYDIEATINGISSFWSIPASKYCTIETSDSSVIAITKGNHIKAIGVGSAKVIVKLLNSIKEIDVNVVVGNHAICAFPNIALPGQQILLSLVDETQNPILASQQNIYYDVGEWSVSSPGTLNNLGNGQAIFTTTSLGKIRATLRCRSTSNPAQTALTFDFTVTNYSTLLQVATFSITQNKTSLNELNNLTANLIETYEPEIVPGYFLKRKTLTFTKNEIITESINERKELDAIAYAKSNSEIALSPPNTIVIEDIRVENCNIPHAQFDIRYSNVFLSINLFENIFSCYKKGVVGINIKEGRHKPLFTVSDLVYVNALGEVYRGNKLPTSTFVYEYVDGEVVISDNDGNEFPNQITNKKPYLVLRLNDPKIYSSQLTLDDTSPSKTMPVGSLFSPALQNKSYVFEVLINDIKNKSMSVFDDSRVEHGKTMLIEKRITSSTALCITGIPPIINVPYYEESEVCSATINGRRPMRQNKSGYNPFVGIAPAFNLAENRVIEVRFRIDILNDNDNLVVATFENEYANGITSINGDKFMLKSNYTEVVDVISKVICSTTPSNRFELKTQDTIEVADKIYNPFFDSKWQNRDIFNTKISAISKNPNVIIYPNEEDVDFKADYPGVFSIPWVFNAYILSPSQGKWSPTIHPGYYYINNEEYFLYKDDRPKEGLAMKTDYTIKDFFVTLEGLTERLEDEIVVDNTFQFADGTLSNTIINKNRIILDPLHDSGEYETNEFYFVVPVSEIEVKITGELYATNFMVSIKVDGVWSDYTEYKNNRTITNTNLIEGVKLKCLLQRVGKDASPVISEITCKGTFDKWVPSATVSTSLLCSVKSDTKKHEVTDRTVNEILSNLLAHNGMSNTRINSVSATTTSDVVIECHEDKPLIARSTTKEEIQVLTNFVSFNEEGDAVLSPSPRLGRPVCARNKGEYLKHITSYDENGALTLLQTDCMVFNGVLAMALKHHDIDGLVVRVKDKSIPIKTIINNIVYFEPVVKIEIGEEIIANYYVKNSFFLDYNYNIEKDQCRMSVFLNSEDYDISNIEVFYETNDNEDYFAKEAEINPLYNPINTGFIYIADKPNEPETIHINYSTTEFKNDSEEYQYVYVEVLDRYGNPVPNVQISARISQGSIVLKDASTNNLGVAAIKYTPPRNWIGDDILTVSCPKYNISSDTIFNIQQKQAPIFMVAKPSNGVFVVSEKEEIEIVIELMEDGLKPVSAETIRVAIQHRPETITTATTDFLGKCSVRLKPIVNAGIDICRIEISCKDIKEYLDLKVVI